MSRVILIPIRFPLPKIIQPKVIYHRVASGENLTVIARKYNTTVDKILKLNRIPNPNLIHPGWVIRVR